MTSENNGADKLFAALTKTGWQPLEAEFYKPLIRYEGREYQLERLYTSDEGLLQIELLTIDEAGRREQAVQEANKKK
jgi:hypothetical protein